MNPLEYTTDVTPKTVINPPNEKEIFDRLKSIVHTPTIVRTQNSTIIKFSGIDSFWVKRFVNYGELRINKSGTMTLTLGFPYQFVLFCFITLFAIIGGLRGSMRLYETSFIILPIWILFFLIKNFAGYVSKQIIKDELKDR